jgi:ubiquinone/menaquinone biosynthesis C-methylase UbiE
MAGIAAFRRMFADVTLTVEDLLLLEPFQIGYFPGWVPEREFATVMWAYPVIRRCLVARCPAVAGLVEAAMATFGPVQDAQELARCGQELVWTIADLIVYNKCPEAYDSQAFHKWDFSEVTSITALDGKVVIDAGAGTGRVALEAADTARHVFAVEPVGRLRQFIRDKAATGGLKNLFVLDGFLDAIPLPDGFADVLITSHALGWRLEDELREMERVVGAGGTLIHCPGTAETEGEEAQHVRLISPDWQYHWANYEEADGRKRKYWKRLAG